MQKNINDLDWLQEKLKEEKAPTPPSCKPPKKNTKSEGVWLTLEEILILMFKKENDQMEKFWLVYEITENRIYGKRNLKPEAEKLAKELVTKNPTKEYYLLEAITYCKHVKPEPRIYVLGSNKQKGENIN